MHEKLFASLLALSACVPPATFVSDVHYENGTLVAEKCNFDDHGRATAICHTEAVDSDDSSAFDPSAPDPALPDPVALDAAKSAASAPAEARPAPREADVKRAIASPSVHRAIELCRARYQRELASFAFELAVAPSGEIAVTPHGVDTGFGECASNALATANLRAFDGATAIFEEQLAL